MSVADCTVKVVLTKAPNYPVKVTDAPSIDVSVEEPVTKVITIPIGARGPAGADGAPGPAGPSARPTKAGTVPGASFSGTPKKFTVTFATPFSDATYVISLSGANSREYTYETKTAAGFVINANAAAVLAEEVSWTAMVAGET